MLPIAFSNNRIGLFGGSYNPPHEGHLRIANHIHVACQLDRVWWIPTPLSPFKSDTSPIEDRIQWCNKLIGNDARHRVTDFEKEMSPPYASINTIKKIQSLNPDIHFVWIMGADCISSFHRWEGFDDIVHTIPIAVISRRGNDYTISNSQFAQKYGQYRIHSTDAKLLPTMKPPSWVYIRGQCCGLSSTLIRNTI